jgi:ParB family transcriptional regulator, chromosome partitioning protein
MSIDFDALSLDRVPSVVPGQANGAASAHLGTPLMLPLNSIDEDPSQPRREFDADALQQLADTIAQRGVRQPISVRIHPTQLKRWIVNFGARRLRASKLAGKTDIPAFIDNTANSYDQVIENEQREGLKPLELALFVQQRLALGETQADIARSLGKSRPYVLYAAALIDAPDRLLAVYRTGRCRGALELHELKSLHSQHQSAAKALVDSDQPLTRERIAEVRARATASASVAAAAANSAERPTLGVEKARTASTSLPKVQLKLEPADSTTNPKAVCPTASALAVKSPGTQCVLIGEIDGQSVEILLDHLPRQDGHVRVQAATDLLATEVPADQIRVLRVVAR